MLNRGTYERRLFKAGRALNVLKDDPKIGGLFGMEGPDSPRLQHGLSLYDAAGRALNKQQCQWAAALQAMERCAATFQTARDLQARLISLARVVITAPSDWDRLGLTGRRPEALAAWHMQAQVFHTNLRHEDRLLLAEVGVTDVMLAEAADWLAQLKADHAACIEAKAEAKAATATKTSAFGALAAFMTRLITMVRGMERTVPHLLAKLGIPRDQRRNRNAIPQPPPSTEPSTPPSTEPPPPWPDSKAPQTTDADPHTPAKEFQQHAGQDPPTPGRRRSQATHQKQSPANALGHVDALPDASDRRLKRRRSSPPIFLSKTPWCMLGT